MTPSHVIIIGAVMSGLTLAQQLKKNDISFTGFERDVKNDSRDQGWALSLFGEAYDVMKTLMPSESGPVEQTSHLYPLDLQPQFLLVREGCGRRSTHELPRSLVIKLKSFNSFTQFSFYDITHPEFRVGVITDETLKVVRAN
ncbi:hypothetical protein ACHAPF_004182 [Botrytis cinerea]